MENIDSSVNTADQTTAAAAKAPARLKSTTSDKNTTAAAASESHREYLDLDTDEEEFGHQETPEPQDEAPAEPDKPVYSAEELQKLIHKTKELATLSNSSKLKWAKNADDTISQFFTEPSNKILSILACTKKGEIIAQLDYPSLQAGVCGVCYFARSEYWQIFKDPKELVGNVIFGSFSGTGIQNYMYRVTNQLYAPLAFKSEDWPKVTREKILGELNDLISCTVDMSYESSLSLVFLYIPAPWDTSPANPKKLARLEKLANNWVRQIRRVISKVQPTNNNKNKLHDLRDEFEFWLGRHDNLCLVSRQLKLNPHLRLILEQLGSVRSTSVIKLRLLEDKVQLAIEESAANLAYLDIILKNCTKEDNNISRVIYLIIAVSKESQLHLDRLLCGFGAHLVKSCAKEFEPKLVFEEPEKCKATLKGNLMKCGFYGRLYDKMNLGDRHHEERRKLVFNNVANFEQRCRDVLEICDAVFIFGSISKISLGGTRGRILESRYKLTISEFLSTLSRLKSRGINYALDITKIQWFKDIQEYRKNLSKLTNTVKNTFNELFDNCSLVMGVQTLHTLVKFKDLKGGFREFILEKWIKLWRIQFAKEFEMCLSGTPRVLVKQDCVIYKGDVGNLGGNRKYLAKLQRIMMDASDWMEFDLEASHKFLLEFKF